MHSYLRNSWLGSAHRQRREQMVFFGRIRGHFAELFADTYDDPFIEDLQNMMLECENDD